jgi:hypothetical protein
MMELILRLPIMLLVWAIQLAIKIPTMLLGFIMVPFTYKYKNTPLKDTPALLTPWINPEDQYGGYPGYPDSLPPFWVKSHGVGRWAHFSYHQNRNPADGLRNFKWLQAPMAGNIHKIKYVTNEYLRHYEPRLMEQKKIYYYFCWINFYLGMKINYVWSDERYFELKFGFRIHPADSNVDNVDLKGTRYILGASMASKFLPYRKWGS